jgi:hypothetical protein
MDQGCFSRPFSVRAGYQVTPGVGARATLFNSVLPPAGHIVLFFTFMAGRPAAARGTLHSIANIF